ncbi:unnamed protein product [Arabidopsis lyrata]|uniref:FBD domain-containing protein n=1 Tax=Arabidopsis lyrata subsp. lyrata TaxID=81972 RepID=D7MJC4_ARALL|nr:putative F-box protein At5g40050 [Arabidopsis lyrata subsp. lyrata]EFH44934.1 hypothetical protein ARALYDRAFT_916257 [Arabidopsis lyrata subsp. lyrata]CAH8277609.1 unnamed protein product [Arabidopsis lyrata]|eukprot:XP_002868675.1 putative F-box protein At5g40050 [Arabidopsis lyrata subsp. lyrata]
MIHGCPELEELYIHHIYTDDREFEFEDIPPTPYYLYHDNIKKLTIRYIDDESYRNLKIYTPNLVYLDYSDSITCEFESENCLNVLLEARLNLVFGWRWRLSNEHINCSKIMDSICNVRILYLSSSTVESMCGWGVCISRINIGGNVVKVLEIQGYKGRLGELNQVKFFLWGMENLEEMKVNISDEIENKLQLTNALLALPKRSSKCNIHVL